LNVLLEKLRDVLSAVLPITLIVLALNFTITPLEGHLLLRFLVGSVAVILGLSVFLFGVDIGVTPIGRAMGASVTRTNRAWIVIAAGLALGFMISIAEPDLHILAAEVEHVTAGVISKAGLVVVVSVGIAVMLTAGLLRIVLVKRLNMLLFMAYAIIAILAVFSSSEFLAIAFDASGATTGAMTVPFMLALAAGVASLKKSGIASEEDSFGLVGVASAGAILAVLAMGVISGAGDIAGEIDYGVSASTSIMGPFGAMLPQVARDVAIALAPLTAVFLLGQKAWFHMPARALSRILKGLIYTFVGLVTFMLGVNAGFMDVGTLVGNRVASLDAKWVVVAIGFVLGMVVVLAEPAVYVLTRQVEEVTSGYVKRKLVLAALSLGIGIAVALSMIRIVVPGVNLWHFLLPGYVISLVLAFIVPNLFVGIAFDAGGVASGPMTATFILAFAHGAADAVEGASVMIDGFGVIAMVAMMPLIALQILGLIFKLKSAKVGGAAHER
jgi:hypothetical protein